MTRARNALLATLLVVGLTTPALAQKPVKIGVLTPLSPPGDAAAGQFIVRGAKMGAEEVNARGGVLGGRKIELVDAFPLTPTERIRKDQLSRSITSCFDLEHSGYRARRSK